MTTAPLEMELFLSALALEGAARAAFVAGVSDAEQRERLQALLSAHDELGEAEPFPLRLRPEPADPGRIVGQTIDGYRIVGVLGRGGMGIVYDAEQQSPRRRVALKTLPLATSSPDAWRRLEREASALARLQHRGIAHVYGTGRARELDDLPYLVMERIEGVPFDVWVASHRLPIAGRLQLLAEVSEAVAHAHERGVVHRDLKPGNVLVQADGTVKVLDFGIARVVDESEPLASLRTRTGQVLGTLPYMSAEQVGADPRAVGVRSDVYSLGVMGYELLAGRLPIAVEGLPLVTAIRRIVEARPRSLGQVTPSLRGDVEAVIGKAMDREAARRYSSAGEFAADLRRLLAGEAVLARLPTHGYQLRKFIGRHRAVVASVCAVVVALAVGLAWALVERGRALAASAAADASAAAERLRAGSMTRTVDLVRDLITAATPQRNGGTPRTITELVDELAERVDVTYADDPHVLGHVHLLLSDVMSQRGLAERAAHHQERAEAEFGRSRLLDARDAAELLLRTARRARSESRYDDAIGAFERGLELATEDVGLHGRFALGLGTLLTNLRRDLPRAEALVRGALADARRAGDPDETSARRHALARVLAASDQSAEAALEYGELVADLRARRPGSHELAQALQNFGHFKHANGGGEEALSLLRESLAVRRVVFRGRPHVELAFALDNLACFLRDAGRAEEALILFDEAEPIFRAAQVEPGADLAICLTERGMAHRRLGHDTESLRDLEEAVAIFEVVAADSPMPAHAGALENLALTRARANGAATAIPLAERAVAVRRRVHGAEHHLVARALEVLATVRAEAGQRELAAEAAREVIELRRRFYGNEHWMTYYSAHLVWSALAAREEFGEALELVRRAVAAVEKTRPAADPLLRRFLGEQRALHERAGQSDAAAAVAARIAALPSTGPTR